MKYFLLFTLKIMLLLIVVNTAKAQSGSGWEWNSTTGTANASRLIRDIATDASGNVYATGTYFDSITLGTTTLTGTPAAYNHAFTVKYNSSGSVLWVNQYKNGAGGVAQSASSIAADANGNVYIGGTDNGTAGGVGKGFVEKYDTNGNLLWNKILSLNEVIGVNVGPDGNPIVIESIPGTRNIYKLDKTTGNISWTVTNTGPSIPVDNHNSYSTFLDAAGNVYYNIGATPFGGSNTTEVIAGKTFINSGSTSYFASVDNNGNTRWIDSTSNVQKGTTSVDKNGKVYLVLSYISSLGGTNQPSAAASTYYELDNQGKVTSAPTSKYPFQNYTAGKLTVKDDGIYVYTTLQGGYSLNLAFGDYFFASPAANTTNLNIVVKYEPSTYKVIWANSFETTGPDITNIGAAAAMDITVNGKVIIGGYYGTTVKFANTLKTATITATNPYSKDDIFVAQFDGANVGPPATTTWTGAANNMNFTDAANWNNGTPNGIKTVIPGGLSNYPSNITAAAKIGKLEVGAGATITLPLAISIPGGIVNNGAIELSEAGIFYGGFKSGQTLVTGTGKIVIKSSSTSYFGYVVLDNSLEINAAGTVVSFGGTITGSLILTNGIFSGGIVLSNPNATITSVAASYVDGGITRAVNTSGSYNFPVGRGTRNAPVTLQLNSVTGIKNITASFTQTINGSAPNTTAGGQAVTQLLDAGIWTITPDVALTGGTYNVTTEGRGFTNGVTDARRYVVLKRTNSSAAWAFVGSNGVATQTSTAVTATAGNITGFSDFAIGIANGSVGSTLPITYTSFTAEKSAAKVLLQWKTLTEINSDYFDIERSTDGIQFNSIGKVNAIGNSTREMSYSFTDNQPAPGLNYYRLHQVDLDGRSTYSTVRITRFDDAAGGSIKCYPNPANGILTIVVTKEMLQETMMVNISNSAGIVIDHKTVEAFSSNNITVDMTTYARGIYFIQVKTNSTNSIERVVLQ